MKRNAIEEYEQVQDTVSLLFNSTLRTAALLILSLEYNSLSSMCKLLRCKSSNLAAILGELIKEGIAERRGRGEYRLTFYGMAIQSAVMRMLDNLDSLAQLRSYILGHEVEVLPGKYLEKLLLLPELRIMGGDAEPFGIQRYIVKMFKSASKLTGITPVVTPEWAEAVSEIAESIVVKLVVTKGCLRETS